MVVVVRGGEVGEGRGGRIMASMDLSTKRMNSRAKRETRAWSTKREEGIKPSLSAPLTNTYHGGYRSPNNTKNDTIRMENIYYFSKLGFTTPFHHKSPLA